MPDDRPYPCGGTVYKDVKILKTTLGGAAANYEFECTTPDGKNKKVVVKGATINDNDSRNMCCNGDFDQ